MMRKRLFAAAAVAAGSCLGLAGGATTAPATSKAPVLGYCSEQVDVQKQFFGYLGPYAAVACLDNSAGGPIGPECMIYTEAGNERECKAWVTP